MILDTSKWSGEGEFTARLVSRLGELPAVAAVRVEDAPASRTEADYNFISNELFVTFQTDVRRERGRRFGFVPVSREVVVKAMTVASLERALAGLADIGEPDYADDG